MQNHNDMPVKPDAASADHGRYLIHSRLEIAAILESLAKSGTLVTAYFYGGSDFILTSVAAVQPEQNRVYVDYGADTAANQRALLAGKITFVAAQARIKVQFFSASLRAARLGGRELFEMAIPATLLRLQRREYFRIATPLTRPLLCRIPPFAAPAQVPAELTVVDISCGGIAIIDSGNPAGIEAGARFDGCRVQLPQLGEVTTGIKVQTMFDVTFRNGTKHRRAGCEFVDMRERDRALIQRYISRLERERKDRASAR